MFESGLAARSCIDSIGAQQKTTLRLRIPSTRYAKNYYGSLNNFIGVSGGGGGGGGGGASTSVQRE